MKRNDWEFKYTGAKLAEAAKAQREFREGRVKVWQEKKEEVRKKISEEGVTVHEDLMDQVVSNNYKMSSTRGGYGPTVSIDPTLQQDLGRCYERIKHHEDLAKEYKAWEAVMSAHPEQVVELNHEDWIYFFGK